MPRRKRKAAKDRGKCVIYARFSSARQREESIEDQVRVCTMFARSNGMEVERVYADRAASARSDDRPQFQRMVSDARDGGWGVVLVYKLDRFARDRFDAASYRVRLRDAGVELVSAMEQIPDAPEGAILESVLDGVNEWYSRSLSQNVRRGMRGNAQKCKANGVTVFGYDIGRDGRYGVNESEAAIVRGAFSMAGSGATRKEVMDWLNAQCRTQRGSRWTYASTATLLTNEKYAGVYSFGDVRVEGGMPAIVTREQFGAAQRRRPHSRYASFPLTGRLFDKETGTPYRGDSGTGCNGTRYLYYSCPLETGTVRYPQSDVEDAVVRVMRSYLLQPGEVERLADAVLEAISDSDDARRLEDARARLREAERGKQRLVDAIVRGIDPSLVQDGLERAGGEVRELEEEVDRLERMTTPDRDWAIAWIRDRFTNNLTKKELRRTVGRCEISGDGTLTVEIPWALRDSKDDEKSSETAGRTQFGGLMFGRRDNSRSELYVSRTCLTIVSGQKLSKSGFGKTRK